MTKEDLEELTKKMRFNLTTLQAQLSDVQRAIAEMVAPDEPSFSCGCGWTGRSFNAFQEHQYRSHDGPVPEHYLAAERAAGLEDEPKLDPKTGMWDTTFPALNMRLEKA